MKKIYHVLYISAITFLAVTGLKLSEKNFSLSHKLLAKTEKISHLKEELERKKPLKNDVKWLALNIYHEARGESVQGMLAVGTVTLNRVESSKYPNSIESVVKQNKQFSWFNDEYSDVPSDVTAWNTSKHIAEILLTNNNLKIRSQLDGVLHYHASSVKPMWAKNMDKREKIGNHIFYN
jgi:spore germination cell wall hydrolase CwlJ-like protein